MNSRILTTTALLCSALFARADVEVTMAQLRNIGFLPQDKADLKPEDKLDLKRTNPFAERKKVVADKPKEGAETEEGKLRSYFEKLSVSGFSTIGGKSTVTLGRHNLEAGDVLQPVIPGQTQILRVLKVDPDLLEIGWVEQTSPDIATPRKITKRIDLTARVRVLLACEDNTGENAQSYYVDDNGKVVLPPKNMLPNPSELVQDLPPGSDTNPSVTLTPEEQAELATLDDAKNSLPPPPAPAPRADTVPDVVPSGDSPPPVGSTEDSVEPDPDMVAPPAEEGAKPAGTPAK